MIWILLGTLILAGTFFVLALVQILSIEARLRHLVVETEERLSKVYKVQLIPPGRESPEGAAESPEERAEDEE